jgi:hypothetical protein
MKKLLSLFIFIFSYSVSYCQQLQWKHSFGSDAGNAIGGINCDTLNNIYFGGAFASGHFSSYSGFYRTKTDPSGNVIWSDTTQLSSSHNPNSFVGDPAGNSIIGGDCGQNFRIGDSLINFPSSYYYNGFMAKLNSNGNVLWTQPFYYSYPKSIVIGNNNMIYASGRADVGTQLDGVNFSYGGFIAKFNSVGQCQKVIHTGTTGVYFSGIDSLNNLYVQTGKDSEPHKLCKYDDNDSLEWSLILSGASIWAMSVDKSGNTFLIYDSQVHKISSDGVISNYPGVLGCSPTGNILSDLNSNVYYSIETATSTNYDTLFNYLNTFDLSTGMLLNSQSLTAPIDYTRLIHSKMTIDNNNDLILGCEQLGGYQPVNIYKFSLNSATGIFDRSILETGDPNIIFYPNPTNGIFTVRIPSGKENRIQVYDLNGNCVKDQFCRNKTDQHVDLSNQPKGPYLLEIISDGKKTVKKAVVE